MSEEYHNAGKSEAELDFKKRVNELLDQIGELVSSSVILFKTEKDGVYYKHYSGDKLSSERMIELEYGKMQDFPEWDSTDWYDEDEDDDSENWKND